MFVKSSLFTPLSLCFVVLQINSKTYKIEPKDINVIHCSPAEFKCLSFTFCQLRGTGNEVFELLPSQEEIAVNKINMYNLKRKIWQMRICGIENIS